MADRMQYAENDPRHHTIKIKGLIKDLTEHVREDIAKVEDPRFKALFETTAEVLGGLYNAYDHAEQKSEADWR